jgi:hypothetical protein
MLAGFGEMINEIWQSYRIILIIKDMLASIMQNIVK